MDNVLYFRLNCLFQNVMSIPDYDELIEILCAYFKKRPSKALTHCTLNVVVYILKLLRIRIDVVHDDISDAFIFFIDVVSSVWLIELVQVFIDCNFPFTFIKYFGFKVSFELFLVRFNLCLNLYFDIFINALKAEIFHESKSWLHSLLPIVFNLFIIFEIVFGSLDDLV